MDSEADRPLLRLRSGASTGNRADGRHYPGSGCDRTRSWTNIAFLGGGDGAEALFEERVFHGPDNSTDIQFSTERAIEAVLNLGPEVGTFV